MKNKKIKAKEILNFLSLVTPLVDMCYEVLAKEYPCDCEEDNFDFLQSLGENFISVPDWVQYEIECDDTQFKFVVDSETGKVSLEPADEHDFCYLSDCVIERLLSEEIDMSDLYDAVDFEVKYGE